MKICGIINNRKKDFWGGHRMINLRIDKEITVVSNDKTERSKEFATSELLGDIIYEFEQHGFKARSAAEAFDNLTVELVKGAAAEKNEAAFTFLGCPIMKYDKAYVNLLTFIEEHSDSKNCVKPTLGDVDQLRIHNQIMKAPLPTISGGMCFDGLKSVTEIAYGILYYYAYNGLKLARCHHCGRWYATNDLHNKYCNRISPCYNYLVNGKPLLSEKEPCKQAVKTIEERFRVRRNKIYKRWNTDGLTEDCNELINQYWILYHEFKEAPTIDVITRFDDYLYGVNMPKRWERKGDK